MEDLTEPELRALMNELATTLQRMIRNRVSGVPKFVLLVFNDPKLTQYVSSCQFEDVVKALQETVGRFTSGDYLERT